MATTKNYKDFILDSLSLLDGIACKPMMGEYLLYYNGILFGGIYDERLLVKKTTTNEKYELEEAKWLKGMGFEVSDNALLIEDRISNVVLGTDRILFTVDPDTLEPNSEVYSSFRDGYTKIDSKDNYKEFRSQEQKYMNYVSNYYFSQKNDAIENATKRILKKENN